MSVLTHIVGNIITLTLIFSCLELFLPKGEMSRFVRLGCALIMLAMIILPAASAIKDMSWEWPEFQDAEKASAHYQQEAEALSMILEAEAMSLYEQDAAINAAAAAALADGIISAEAVVEADDNGIFLQMEIYAVKDPETESPQAEKNIRDILGRYYTLKNEDIRIIIREEQA